MNQYKVTIRRVRIGSTTDDLEDVVTAETFRRALDKVEKKLLTPLRFQGLGKQTVYSIIKMELVERGKSNADDN